MNPEDNEQEPSVAIPIARSIAFHGKERYIISTIERGERFSRHNETMVWKSDGNGGTTGPILCQGIDGKGSLGVHVKLLEHITRHGPNFEEIES